MARKIPSLGRFLGAPTLYALAYGEISSSLYYALGLTALYALSLTPVVFLAAGLLFALAAAAYAEGGATIPEGGGSSALSRRAWGDLAGFIAGWATVLGVPQDQIGRKDHFFDRGGTSLSAVKLAVNLDRVVSLKEVTRHPILADLADVVDGKSDRQSELLASPYPSN